MRDPRFESMRQFEQHPPTLPEHEAAARLLAEKAAMGPVDVALLLRIEDEELKKIEAGKAWSIFTDTFAAKVINDPERGRAWSEALATAVRNEMQDLGKLAFDTNQRDYVVREADEWRLETNPFEVWDNRWDRVHISHWTTMYEPLGHLLRIDSDAWMHVVDELLSPRWMGLARFFSRLIEDYDLLLELLRRAPPILDLNGQRQSVVALLLLEWVEEHANELYEAVDFPARTTNDEALRAKTKVDLEALRKVELPEKLQQAYRVMLERADGNIIAHALLARLGRNVLFSVNPEEGFSVAWAAFDALAEVLAKTSISIADLKTTWSVAEEKETNKAQAPAKRRLQRGHRSGIGDRLGEGKRTLYGDGLPTLLGAANILSERPPSQEAAESLWRWFEQLLVGRDPALSLVQHGSSMQLVPRMLGYALTRLQDPPASWRATYKALEPQRRRALYRSRYHDSGDLDIDLGSRLLISTGLRACEIAMMSADRDLKKEATHAWFWVLFDAARRLWLTCDFDLNRAREDLLLRCFWYLPHIIRDDVEPAAIRALQTVATTPSLLRLAAWALWKNGIDVQDIERYMREVGVDLRRLIRAGEKDGDNERDALADFRAALGMGKVAGQAEAIKKNPDLQRDFVRGIRWGRHWLKRLEDEGCSVRTIAPLDRRATAWWIQVRLSDTISKSFGLAPEARILVVHGFFDANDLSRVIDEPRNADTVDPDLILVACDRADLARRLPLLAGPWGQRIPWSTEHTALPSLSEVLRQHLPAFDIFDRRDPVKGRQHFGRKALTQKLAAKLSRGEAFGVFGLRKVGKSSLLRAVVELIDPVAARRGFFEGELVPLPDVDPHALVVSLDIQGVADRSLAGVAMRIAERLEDRCKLAGLASVELPIRVEVFDKQNADRDVMALDWLDRLLRFVLERSPLPVCVVLDEYDLLFGGYAGEMGIVGIERLFQLLRGLAQDTRRVSVAVIGRDPVFFQQPLMNQRTNPMLGWAEMFFLGPLAREEADEMLVRLGLRVGLTLGPTTLDTAWELTGGHPLLHRQFGSALHEYAETRRSDVYPLPTDSMQEEVRKRFLERDLVRSLATEVFAILRSRFSDAYNLLCAMTAPLVEWEDLPDVFANHGGWDGDAALVLRRFGLVQGAEMDSLSIAHVFWSGIRRARGIRDDI